MKKLIFRADGNSATGLGHLYRIFALIEIYKHKFEFTLVSSEYTTTGIVPDTYPFLAIPAHIPVSEEPQWLSEHFRPQDHWIIADGYQFTETYQRSLKEQGYQLAYIDDLQRGHQYADVVINHSLTAKMTDYEAEPYTRFALGTRYAILRPLFLEAAEKMHRLQKITTAFICFGGADPLDLTLKAATALSGIDQFTRIHVVVGGAYVHKGIETLKNESPKIRIHRNVSEAELLGVMEECQFSIVSSSTVLYEVCCVKMPVLSGYYVENQRHLYKGCLENKLIFEGGNFEGYTAEDFQKKTMAILTDPHIQTKLDAQSKCFDACIKERFLELIRDISYRKANEGDMKLIYDWANDKVSRENSYFTEPIALETHKTWFEKKLQDSSSALYIAEVDGVPAGMVRYDLAAEHAVVGISVAESFRGKGLAPVFLSDTAKLHFKGSGLPVWAYIKQQNTASVRSFEKAGYQLLKEETVHGADSFVYTLQK